MLLLSDLRRIFDADDSDSMSTADILEALLGFEESPWKDIRGKELNARTLATHLRNYGVTSKNVRVRGQVLKSYDRRDLEDAWARYLPPGGPEDDDETGDKPTPGTSRNGQIAALSSPPESATSATSATASWPDIQLASRTGRRGTPISR